VIGPSPAFLADMQRRFDANHESVERSEGRRVIEPAPAKALNGAVIAFHGEADRDGELKIRVFFDRDHPRGRALAGL
jgi:hypothetical protein